MKTIAVIAASMIAAGSLGTAALAAGPQHKLSGQEKSVRYQHDQRQKMWDQERQHDARATHSATFGAPNRQSFGRAEPESATQPAAPSSFSVPGSGAAFYNYDANNKSWAYGY